MIISCLRLSSCTFFLKLSINLNSDQWPWCYQHHPARSVPDVMSDISDQRTGGHQPGETVEPACPQTGVRVGHTSHKSIWRVHPGLRWHGRTRGPILAPTELLAAVLFWCMVQGCIWNGSADFHPGPGWRDFRCLLVSQISRQRYGCAEGESGALKEILVGRRMSVRWHVQFWTACVSSDFCHVMWGILRKSFC